ncbi:ATP-dependent DNA helicase [Halobellus ruber]|uniref:DNA 3'-5' helicase n=1 Tax=Halobellus ruber TaxID=2761102 RepID=A0A7J9SNE9_9EURY|nr:ATP-dependent DNA helicase [Halobellus ruber]MBB6647749.1 ATP-dependent helicase [Halobellus ruber]
MDDLPLNESEFVRRLEEANQERFDDPDWSFNDPQQRAILHDEGPLHVTAGPGSGKTEVLVSRTLKLLLVDSVPPGSILLTTFTEKAAQSLEERIVDRLDAIGFGDAVDANEIRVGTLHSLCNDIMQEYRYQDYANVELLDEDGQQLFMYRHCDFVDYISGSDLNGQWDTVPEAIDARDEDWRFFEELHGWQVHDQHGPNKWQATEITSKLFNRVSQYRASTNRLRRHKDRPWRACAEGLEKYRETLREQQRCDFARLLERFIEFIDTEAGQRFIHGESGRERPALQHVLVDEYQDTNPLQQELYFQVLEEMNRPNITVVGDDDQALYRFRGGTVECLIQFPKRLRERFGTFVESVQLRTNYRSTKDIISWCNRYIDNHPAMQVDGARAPGKQPMEVGRDGTENIESVRAILEGNSDAEPAAIAAELVDRMHDTGYIDDYSQVAYLFKSTKETDRWAGQFVTALRERGIPVHNPRNKAFLDQPEVEFALGAIIRALDPELDALQKRGIQGRVTGQIQDWYDGFDEYVDQHDATALDRYVDQIGTELRATEDESLGLNLLDLFYRILSFDPFLTWVESDDAPARGRRLGQLSKLFDAFASVSGRSTLTASSWANSVSTKFLADFYYLFCGYLHATDFDEPQDPHDQLPSGFVQVMTVHQAKGLEFPVVFTSDLDSEPWTFGGTYWIEEELAPYADISPLGGEDERSVRDEIRRFYVAYSRAQEDLLLLDQADTPTQLTLGYDDGTALTTDWFDGSRRINTPDDFLDHTTGSVGELHDVDLKRRYSITGDVLAYRRCKRQYGYYTDLDFAPNHVTQLFFGRVVHETLDRAHRHYAGELDGSTEGTMPTDDDIERYFREVAEALKTRNIYPMSEDAEQTALQYIQRFNRREGDRLYPRVIDTERRLQSNREEFVLEGVVDVLVGDDDGREIWDYKAGRRPDSGHELTDYSAQLKTYAELYRYARGSYPDRGVIYFLGEETRTDAMFELTFDDDTVQDSLADFERTVQQIQTDREAGNWFDITPADAPSEGTCAECDIRWSCPARPEYSLED